MKLRIIILILFPMFALAQQTPQKINFQSVLRNNSGEVVGNRLVNIRISILSGSSSGTNVFSETHIKTTDALGLISLQIGTGSPVAGIFSNINWGNQAYFLKLEADFNGGTTYEFLGTQELMSVPFALYAGKTDTSVLDLANRFSTKLNVTDTFNMLLNYRNALNDKAPINSPTFTGTVGGIDKTMVGLGNVDNTTDAGKPVSTATQDSLELKAPIDSPTFTGTVVGIDKTMVGLENVDNTSDLTKPISEATQLVLDNKVNLIDTGTMLSVYLRKTDAIITDLQNQVALLSSYTSLLSSYTSLLGSVLVDIDGNNYPVVKIGNQIWMKENLRVRRYNNGTAILFDASGGSDGNGSDFTWGGLTYGAHTLYAHDSTATPSNLTKYGYLYNWYAAKGISTAGEIANTDTLNICPTGWHVPTDAEWTTLTTDLGGESEAGGKMKSVGTAYWNSPNTGATNETGFSALPGGSRSSDGSFDGISYYAFFWSATEIVSNVAWNRNLDHDNGNVYRDSSINKSVGASVRCLRD